MSAQICEWLQLDRERVLAHAMAYQGLAYAREAAGPDDMPDDFLAAAGGFITQRPAVPKPGNSPVGAHYLKIAAAYFCAAAPDRAGKCFAAATAWAERQLELAGDDPRADDGRRLSWLRQALVMDACQAAPTITEPLAGLEDEIDRLEASALGELIAVVLRHLTLPRGSAEPRQRAMADLLRAVRGREQVPTGVLQLPLDFVVRLGRMMTEGSRDATRLALLPWAREFAGRLAERMAIAQSSPRHWRVLYSRLLPIEPEALLVVAAWRHLARRTYSAPGFAEQLQHLPPVMQAYAEAARVMFETDAGPDYWRPDLVPVRPIAPSGGMTVG